MDMDMSTYEQLVMLIYLYRMGHISFLELVEQFEEVLGIEPSPPDRQTLYSTFLI